LGRNIDRAVVVGRLVQKLKRSRGLSVVVVEHSAETLAPPDLPIRGSNLQCWLNNSAIEPLMVSLKVVILEILVDHIAGALLRKKSFDPQPPF